jgi:Phage Tail Collar Domain
MKKVILIPMLMVFYLSFINAQDAITVNSSGNVGINNSSPSEKLDVNGNLKVNGNIAVNTINAIGKLDVNSNMDVNGNIKSTGKIEANLRIKDQSSEQILRDILKHLNPVGTIQAYGGISDPDGYMICDGRALLRSEYPDLFAVIGTSYGAPDSTRFNIPDLRGEFLRGADNGAGVDTDTRQALKTGGNTSGVGSKQGDLLKNHLHTTYIGTHDHIIGVGDWTTSGPYPENWGGGGPGYSGPNFTNSTDLGSKQSGNPDNSLGGVESRPKNVAVNFIIKL